MTSNGLQYACDAATTSEPARARQGFKLVLFVKEDS